MIADQAMLRCLMTDSIRNSIVFFALKIYYLFRMGTAETSI